MSTISNGFFGEISLTFPHTTCSPLCTRWRRRWRGSARTLRGGPPTSPWSSWCRCPCQRGRSGCCPERGWFHQIHIQSLDWPQTCKVNLIALLKCQLFQLNIANSLLVKKNFLILSFQHENWTSLWGPEVDFVCADRESREFSLI